MTLLSLHNATQRGRYWQPYGQSGSGTLPASAFDVRKPQVRAYAGLTRM